MNEKIDSMNLKIFRNIEWLYHNYPILLESDKFRLCKSFPRNIFVTYDKLIEIYRRNNLKENYELAEMLAEFEYNKINDTFNTNINLLKLFNLIELHEERISVTNKFIKFYNDSINLDEYILEEMRNIHSVDDFNSIYNGVLCTLREGYMYNGITVYPDSNDGFINKYSDIKERKAIRKKVFDIYGFSGRNSNPENDDYTPNANYRIITVLTKLELVEKESGIFVITQKGIDLLKRIDSNLEIYRKRVASTLNEVGYNKIYYGIPGCGKSYYIEHTVLENVDKEHNVFRTTFFLDYSNSDFVGQILPIVENGHVTYEPIPGPFTKALERALTVENEMVYLVIEEINRGNAAAIFGDVFQLLDRLKEDYDDRVIGDSEYPITNEFIELYFEKQKINYNKGKIFIPHNLTILATMNTSDQNVFPLDTAFKRRWDRKRIVPNWEKVKFRDLYIPFTEYTWERFVELINTKMLDESIDGIIMEDKQIGPYFISKDLLATKNEKDDVNKNEEKLERFVNNVIDYIYSDVSKFDRENWFDPNVSFDDIYNEICKYKSDEKTDKKTFSGNRQLCLKLDDSNNSNEQDTNEEGKDEK